MGVQRIQETSTASYGKSVEAAAAGNSYPSARRHGPYQQFRNQLGSAGPD